MQTKHLCASCYFGKKKEYMLPARMCGVEAQDEFYAKYVAEGCWKSAGIDSAGSSDHFNFHYVE